MPFRTWINQADPSQLSSTMTLSSQELVRGWLNSLGPVFKVWLGVMLLNLVALIIFL
ncbi:MAG: hypothetical protein QE263_04960 [Vampirovibrionales bacterium]|jgi:hypothetical protein|nr:hypothetical protein [Vampirovibrionales bacterium]